jgi:TetR/AcrR family acrAB operon transcriptional repressor
MYNRENAVDMARCTKEEAQETRCRILDAAEDAFHEQGVARTSLEDIAQAAGVTRGAIYWHFKNKSDLFDAMCERVRLPMEAMVQAAGDEKADDPLGQLRAACLFTLLEAAKRGRTRKVLGILYHRCEYVDDADPIMARQQQKCYRGTDNIERILKNAVARKQLPPDLDTRVAAIMFHASWAGLLNNWLFSPKSFDLARDAERFVDACIDNLRHAHSLRRQ